MQNHQSVLMTSPPYDLEERTATFAKAVRAFVQKLPKSITNREDIPQLIRSSGSIAANYIEANDAIGTKDFYKNMRVSRREAKETRLWLSLLDVREKDSLERERLELHEEAHELVLILSSIIKSSSRKS